MSVYTKVNSQDLVILQQRYDLGRIHQLQGISEGIENTNYFLSCERGEYVLTLFESIDENQVSRIMRFMHFLAEHAIPSSDPLANREGFYVDKLHEKPLSIVKRIDGCSVQFADSEQLASLAKALAGWHNAVKEYPEHWDCRYELTWQTTAFSRIASQLPKNTRDTLADELKIQSQHDYQILEQGIIHSDLFRDNALFNDTGLTGIIDLYDACNSPFLYDLAVVVNDWCRGDNGLPDEQRVRHFLGCYFRDKPLAEHEREHWPAMLRRAALRFWLSRSYAQIKPKTGHMALQKPPQEYAAIVAFWRQEVALALRTWPKN